MRKKDVNAETVYTQLFWDLFTKLTFHNTRKSSGKIEGSRLNKHKAYVHEEKIPFYVVNV